MHLLSKSTYIKGLQCEKALYMTKKHPYLRDKLSVEQRAKFQRGTDVGILAQQCFPGGVNMSPNSPTQFPKRVQESMANLHNSDINVMYEAVFQFNDTLVMLDILVRDGQQWKAIEVKSSLKLSPTYYHDAALQHYVLHGCGVPLSDFQLMHLNPDYVKEGPIDVHQLFHTVSVLDYVKEQEANVAANVERLKNVIAQPHSPLVKIGSQCHEPYPCDFLGHCWKLVPKTLELDYKALFAQAPDPKPRSIAYLNLLMYRPAVPELDGTRPYQEMVLAFAINGNQEPEGHTVWDCFEDHRRWQEWLEILKERLSHYELIVCFTPLDLTSLMRHEKLRGQEFGHKVFNLYEVLTNARFYHPEIKAGYNLKHVMKAIFPDSNLFEHNKILVEANAMELTGYQQAREDLVAENEAVAQLYQHFFKNTPVHN